MANVRRHPSLVLAAALCTPILFVGLLMLAATWYDVYSISRLADRSDVRIHIYRGACTLTASRNDASAYFPRLETYWITPDRLEAHHKKHFDGATDRRGFGPVRRLSGTLGVSTFSMLRFPLWPLMLVLPIPIVTLCVVQFRADKHRGAPLCPKCGYDLTGCVERCTECNWTMPYPLALRLALVRDLRTRRKPVSRTAPGSLLVAHKMTKPLETTKPTDESVGPVR